MVVLGRGRFLMGEVPLYSRDVRGLRDHPCVSETSIDPLSASHTIPKLPLEFRSTNPSTLGYHVADGTEHGGDLRDVDRPAAIHVECVKRRYRLRP